MRKEIPRVLMINDHIHFGGGGDAVFGLERRAYEEAGYDVFTFSQAGTRPADISGRDFVAAENKSRTLQRVGKFLFAPTIARSFREVLRSVRPHFVSVHLVSKYPLSIYPQLASYPVVQTLHGPNLFCATSWGCLKNGRPCEMGVGGKCFTRGCMSLSGTVIYMNLYSRLLGSVKNNVDRFICPSRHILESAESLGFTPTEFMPYGVDESFKNVRVSTHDGSPVVLFVGQLAEQKGVQVLLDAFRTIVAEVEDAELQIAGRGPMSSALMQQSFDYDIADRVSFLGFVDRSAIVDCYKRASVLVVPSIYKEQFGLVGPEALACGVPCVGSDFGGIPEWLSDGEWGFTVPPRDAQALAERVVTLLKDADLRRKFGTDGREWALSQYSPDTYKENRLRLVRELAFPSAQ